jgi:hypothetical protein
MRTKIQPIPAISESGSIRTRVIEAISLEPTHASRKGGGRLRGISILTGKEEYEEEDVNVIVGFAFTTEMPFNHVKVRLEPKYPNITPEKCVVVPVLSRTYLRLFWAFSSSMSIGGARARLADLSGLLTRHRSKTLRALPIL